MTTENGDPSFANESIRISDAVSTILSSDLKVAIWSYFGVALQTNLLVSKIVAKLIKFVMPISCNTSVGLATGYCPTSTRCEKLAFFRSALCVTMKFRSNFIQLCTFSSISCCLLEKVQRPSNSSPNMVEKKLLYCVSNPGYRQIHDYIGAVFVGFVCRMCAGHTTIQFTAEIKRCSKPKTRTLLSSRVGSS